MDLKNFASLKSQRGVKCHNALLILSTIGRLILMIWALTRQILTSSVKFRQEKEMRPSWRMQGKPYTLNLYSGEQPPKTLNKIIWKVTTIYLQRLLPDGAMRSTPKRLRMVFQLVGSYDLPFSSKKSSTNGGKIMNTWVWLFSQMMLGKIRLFQISLVMLHIFQSQFYSCQPIAFSFSELSHQSTSGRALPSSGWAAYS